MAWETLTVQDLESRLTGAELDALRSAALAEGQGDPAPEVLTRAVDEARGYLAARPSAALGPAGTIPAQARGAVLDLARYRLLTRLAAGRAERVLVTETRRREYEDAVMLLREVAAGRFAVEDPATLTTEALPPAPRPRITPRSRPDCAP